MFGVGAFAELAFADLPAALDFSTADPFRLLLEDPNAPFVFLMVAQPFDPEIAQEILAVPAPFATVAFAGGTTGDGTTFTVQGAETPVYLSDVGFTTEPADSLANVNFAARLLKPYELRMSLFSGDEPDGRVESSAGAVTIANGDAGLDAWAGWAWDGRDVEILVGAEGFAYDEFATVHLGTAGELSWTEDAVTVPLPGRGQIFERPIQQSLYAGTGGLEGGADLEGQVKPLAFGRVRNVTPAEVSTADLVYQVHDGRVQSIDAVRDQGVALTDAGDVADLFAASVAVGTYKTDLAHGCFRLGAAPNGQVTADVEGDVVGGVYVSAIADVAKRIVTTRVGAYSLSDADLDLGSFNALATAQPAVCGIYLDGDVTVAEVLSELLGSIGGWWDFNRDGTMFVGRLEAPAAPIATLDDSQIGAGALEAMRVVPPSWRRRVSYRRNWTVQRDDDLAGSVSDADRAFYAAADRFVTASDTSIRGRHRQARDVETRTFFDLEADATADAVRLLALHGVPRTRWRAAPTGALFRYFPGDDLALDVARFDLDGGKRFVVVALEETGADHGTVLELWG